MSSVNKAILVGNVGKDITTREVGDAKVATFTLATSKKYKDNEKTTWHNIVMWRGLAEIAEKYVKKGSKIYIEGEIENREYEDKDGNKRYVSEIVANNMQMLDSRDKNYIDTSEKSGVNSPKKSDSQTPSEKDFPNNELPF